MSNKFTRYLSDFGSGFLGGLTRPKGRMANWRHASRLFIDNTYRLSPKTKFLFYVNFEIDPRVRGYSLFNDKHRNEAGLLVKSVDLPKFNFDSVIKNQYNRKKILYKQINYEPVNVVMHDDNNAVTNAMWALYYGYYIADRHLPEAAFSANHLRVTSTPQDNFTYGMDNDINAPFFRSVSIYTMSRRRFIGYTLVNPRIKSWSHGNMDYAASEFNDNQMSLEYEAVRYSSGNVTFGSPKGFATLHYDSVPSPLSIAGGGVATLTGQGGVLDGLEQVFGEVGSKDAFKSPKSFLGTAIKAFNTYKNFSELTTDQIASEAVNILSDPNNIRLGISKVSGVVGTVFPKSSGNADTTTATTKKLVP